jgi:hypothetical protein
MSEQITNRLRRLLATAKEQNYTPKEWRLEFRDRTQLEDELGLKYLVYPLPEFMGLHVHEPSFETSLRCERDSLLFDLPFQFCEEAALSET